MLTDAEIEKLVDDHKRGRISLSSVLESDSIYPISGEKLKGYLLTEMNSSQNRTKIMGKMLPKNVDQKETTITAEIITDSAGHMKQLEIRCPTRNTVIARLTAEGLQLFSSALDNKLCIKTQGNGVIKINQPR
ncbi:MAG: hypothetical protein GTN99_02835 [Candidatus Dadabacteria bacterium]|nr:hypothetical protein [Candidatus Dadabacteria bacterium]